MATYSEIKHKFTMEVDSTIKLDDVILSSENRKAFDRFILEMKHKDKLIENRLKPMNKLLLYGASGCGKTYVSKALANELGYKMFYIDIANTLATGNIAQNMKDIFSLGNYCKDCIIFFDECDSIGWNRDSSTPESGDIRRATNSLFQHLDQMNPSNVFIGATNMIYRLDLAFIRRFDLKLKFTSPNLSLVDTFNRFKYSKFEIIDDINPYVRGVIEKRNKLSYYEIQCVMERAMKKAVIEDRNTIGLKELFEDVAHVANIKIAMN